MGNISKIIGNLEVAFVRGDGTFFKMAPGRFIATTTLNKTTWYSVKLPI